MGVAADGDDVGAVGTAEKMGVGDVVTACNTCRC